MKLKKLKIDSTYEDFYDIFYHNKKVVNGMAVREDVYYNFIKILCVFPLEDKKLKYFLKLDDKSKVGYMSKYIMSIARKMNIPNSIIKYFFELKDMTKFFTETTKTEEEVIELFKTDVKKFFNEYDRKIKKDLYIEQLSKFTSTLCSAIFEKYDKAKHEILKEQ